MTQETGKKTTRKKRFPKNPIWQFLNEKDFVLRCRGGDEELLARLRALEKLPKTRLGALARKAFENTDEKIVGTFFPILIDGLKDEAIGEIVQVTIANCDVPKH